MSDGAQQGCGKYSYKSKFVYSLPLQFTPTQSVLYLLSEVIFPYVVSTRLKIFG